jgi:hypothetical protein
MDNAFEYIKNNGGLATEDAYPYHAANGTCDAVREKKSPVLVLIDGHQDVPANSEEGLAKAVANQPVSVAIDASGQAFQFYSEGVFTGDCGTELAGAEVEKILPGAQEQQASSNGRFDCLFGQ